jgi:hypothetical protein
MAAEFVDALLGYDYFLEKRGKVTKDEINDYLVTKGRRPIQQRTYTHYKKLIENGFLSYIPINKFDVFQSLGKLQMAADRRRYNRDKLAEPVQISRDGLDWVDASLTDISIVGFGIVSSRFPVRPGTQIWLRYNEYSDIPIIVVWRKHEGAFTKMGVRALEFIAEYRLPGMEIENEMPRGHLTITRSDEGEISWHNLYRILSQTNELLIATNSLIYTVADQTDSEIRIATPIVESIKFGSPGGVEILTALGVSKVLERVFGHLSHIVLDKKRYMEETRKQKLENDGLRLDNEKKEINTIYHETQVRQEVEKRSLENINLKIETLRNAYKLATEIKDPTLLDPLVGEIKEQLKAIVGVPELPPGAFEPGTLERSILEKRILPPAAELAGGDDPDYQISASTEQSL